MTNSCQPQSLTKTKMTPHGNTHLTVKTRTIWAPTHGPSWRANQSLQSMTSRSQLQSSSTSMPGMQLRNHLIFLIVSDQRWQMFQLSVDHDCNPSFRLTAIKEPQQLQSSHQGPRVPAIWAKEGPTGESVTNSDLSWLVIDKWTSIWVIDNIIELTTYQSWYVPRRLIHVSS